MSFDNWFMFPIAIVIATIAMSSGISGAIFFTPIFLLGLGLSPEVAIGAGLITVVFGFTSGLVAYLRRKLVDFKLAGSMLMFSIPRAVVGVVTSNYVNPNILKAILGMGLFAVAYSLLRSPALENVKGTDQQIENENKAGSMRSLTSADGEQFCYTIRNKWMGAVVATVGGFFTGMISTGLGELNSYYLLQRCKVPGKVAVATSVFTVAFTAMAAATGHLINFASGGGETLGTVFGLVVFTAPGVVIGGQLGPYIATKISQHALKKSLAVLFILVASLMLGQLIFT